MSCSPVETVRTRGMRYSVELVRCAVWTTTVCGLAWALPSQELYPYGQYQGDSYLPKSDDIASEAIQLSVPITFYKETYNTIFVNNNGMVSLLGPLEIYVSVQFPLDYLVIAPFYSNVDTRKGGTVWYRESTDRHLLDKAAGRLASLYPSARPQPTSIFIVTWDRVAHSNSTGQENTYQLAISSDGKESFVEMMYPDDGLQWIRTRGQGLTQADGKAQAGIVTHDGRLVSLPHSGTDQIRHLDKLSNSGEPGLFVFRIGNIDEADNLEPPPNHKYHYEQEPTSCARGSTKCHSMATCEETEQGICCVCQKDYYGNGINCLHLDSAVRVSGKIVMAGEEVDMYLQAYLEPSTGASYTAITRIPKRMGPSVQLLEPLAATLGWLVAKPISGGVNGFQLTGGVFNSTVNVVWPGGERMSVKARYMGVDLVDQIRMEAEVSGVLPAVPSDRTLNVPDYHHRMTISSPGVLVSHPDAQIRVLVGDAQAAQDTRHHGSKGLFLLTKKETISYEDRCSNLKSFRLKSSRHQLVYRLDENLVRFASINKISSDIEGEDPCIEGHVKCVANSSCVVDGDSFKCVCNPGFEVTTESEDGADGCQDVNECEDGSAGCHVQAICLNEVGSFTCRCRPGFRGDGQHCQSDDECAGGSCNSQPVNGYCEDPADPATCSCNPGFAGYGGRNGELECWDVNECEDRNMCGGESRGECINTEGSFYCKCHSGYRLEQGRCTQQPEWEEEDRCEEDPESCQPDHGYCIDYRDLSTCRCVSGWTGRVDERGVFSCLDVDECSEGQPCDGAATHCINTPGSYKCECRHGFMSDDGYTCVQIPGLGGCNELDCGPRSTCEEDLSGPRCVCDSQFSGIYPTCIDVDKMDCLEDSDCGENGMCHLSSEHYKCVCKPGYVGNGYVCSPDSGSNSPSDKAPSSDRREILVRTCLDGVCWCPEGYREEGPYCFPIQRNVCKETCGRNAQCVYVSQTHESQCACNPGYEGDGLHCSPMEISCSVAEICDINAQCTFDDTSNSHICICNEGYVGDGTTCYPTDECTTWTDCDRPHMECHYNEERLTNECVCAKGYDTDIEGHCILLHTPDESDESCIEECSPNASCESNRCVCNIGYRGDGLTCMPDCSQLSNYCSPYAECVYNNYNYSYTCICNKGYEGDGLECRLIRNCYNTPEMCSRFATCLRTAHHTFTCTCNQGYYGNGTFCREGTRLDSGGFLLVNQGRSTQRIPLEPSPTDWGKPIHVHFDQVPIGIGIDCVEGRVYWSDIARKTIQSSNYDGSDIKPTITSGIGSSEGVAVDWINRAIYWTDSEMDTVSKAYMDAKEVITIVSEGLENPRGIAVHPARRKVYWSDWNRDDPKLESSNLDGKERSLLLKGSRVKLPNSLAVDWITDELCWADAGTNSIECLSLSSGRQRTAVKSCKYPFGLAITSQKYYWTDWTTNKIESATKDGRRGESQKMIFGGDDRLYGLVAVPQTCPS